MWLFIRRQHYRRKMMEMTKPILSPRFDVDDIQKLREYNSMRHIKMTPAEIVAETKKATDEIIAQLMEGGNVQRISPAQ